MSPQLLRSRSLELPYWQLLKPHMWISKEWYSRAADSPPVLEIHLSARLIPNLDAVDAKALQRSFLDTLDTVLDLMVGMSLCHTRHPAVTFSGEALHHLDGRPDEFAEIKCDVEFVLLWRLP